MEKRYLIAKINTYKGNAERQKHRADQFYAKYKSSNDPDDYRQSQYYYEESRNSMEIARVYEEKLNNGDYE